MRANQEEVIRNSGSGLAVGARDGFDQEPQPGSGLDGAAGGLADTKHAHENQAINEQMFRICRLTGVLKLTLVKTY